MALNPYVLWASALQYTQFAGNFRVQSLRVNLCETRYKAYTLKFVAEHFFWATPFIEERIHELFRDGRNRFYRI